MKPLAGLRMFTFRNTTGEFTHFANPVCVVQYVLVVHTRPGEESHVQTTTADDR